MTPFEAFCAINPADTAQVVQAGHKLLHQSGPSHGEEYWSICERVLIAALDRFDHFRPIAADCLGRLEKQFGSRSLRIMRLAGMFEEAKGDFEAAAVVYHQILERDPSNAGAMKRLIALAGQLEDASRMVTLLVDYLEIYMNDAEAWKLLASLYCRSSCYEQAIFCYEQLFVIQETASCRILCAEALYTRGDIESLVLARKYYCRALELTSSSSGTSVRSPTSISNAVTCGETTRALQGIFLTSQRLLRLRSRSPADPAIDPEQHHRDQLMDESMLRRSAESLLSVFGSARAPFPVRQSFHALLLSSLDPDAASRAANAAATPVEPATPRKLAPVEASPSVPSSISSSAASSPALADEGDPPVASPETTSAPGDAGSSPSPSSGPQTPESSGHD
ncbi:hypothetical protein H696_00812 [Fonticula alba]|uniref:ER membrane protein complex subunit 2 n=1 Tax=Fonticula alba TaxID=691883 RepID=A0A058ZFV1_FONAL|nr:hypothetical protein H696_00812 [Fonticula alba]KCV73270.1 hypothetical protein H696_00812 [Fonticula alba]|eukprot:XP_009492971.1 hypothetical protein H696_00812 [Fonticula alba]